MTSDRFRRLRRGVILFVFVVLGVIFAVAGGGSPMVVDGQPAFDVHGTLHPANWVLWWSVNILFYVTWVSLFVTIVLTRYGKWRETHPPRVIWSARGLVMLAGDGGVRLPGGLWSARCASDGIQVRRWLVPAPFARPASLPLGVPPAVRLEPARGQWRISPEHPPGSDGHWAVIPLNPRHWAMALRAHHLPVLPAELDPATLPRVQATVLHQLWGPLLARLGVVTFLAFALILVLHAALAGWGL